MEPTEVTLPDRWVQPKSTLAPLLAEKDPQWFRIMSYVCTELERAGNPQEVLVAYRDQAMEGDFKHLVQISMVFMGEMELEHEGMALN